MVTRAQKLLSLATLTIGLWAFDPAQAHHSFAMYEPEKIVTVEGTVKEFKWANPHVLLKVAPAGDEANIWTMELTAPGQLSRNGWTHTTIKPGDAVKVQVRPFRDGRLGGAFVSVTVNGEEIKR